jgi:hypothetical protein
MIIKDTYATVQPHWQHWHPNDIDLEGGTECRRKNTYRDPCAITPLSVLLVVTPDEFLTFWFAFVHEEPDIHDVVADSETRNPGISLTINGNNTNDT